MEWMFHYKRVRCKMERKRNGNFATKQIDAKYNGNGTETEWKWNGNKWH